jgi:hypothetical protein
VDEKEILINFENLTPSVLRKVTRIMQHCPNYQTFQIKINQNVICDRNS